MNRPTENPSISVTPNDDEHDLLTTCYSCHASNYTEECMSDGCGRVCVKNPDVSIKNLTFRNMTIPLCSNCVVILRTMLNHV